MIQRLLFLAILLLPTAAHSNEYWTHGSFPATGTAATSAGMRAELDAISAGFDKLPALSGNADKLVTVNSSGTGLTTTAGTITIPVALAVSGAYGVTLNVTGTTSLTLPTSGTVATLAGAENLSNKTIAAPTITGSTILSGTGPHIIGGTPTNVQYQLLQTGTFAPGSSSAGRGFGLRSTLTGQVGQDVYGAEFLPSITRAASGTHGLVATVEVEPPYITGSGATITTAATLYVGGAPTAGTNNYSLKVVGASYFGAEATFDAGHITVSGGTNPYLKFNDGTSDSYLQVASGKLDLYNLSHLTFSPGLSEKARVTSDGILQVGSTDTTGLSSGGASLEGGLRFTEISDPTAPSTNHATLYARDDGSGNTVLAVQFPTGAPITIVRENVGVIPPGTVTFWGGGSAPSGWLLTNGANVSRTTYALLFAAIGTTFGSGDGSTTFTLPTLSNYTTNIKGMIKC